MTIDETSVIMDIISIAYPHYYNKQTEDERYMAAVLWAEMFSEDDVNVVKAALKSFIATDEDGYAPNIGKIKSKVRLLTTPAEMSEGEAWGLVYKALGNGAYGYKEEFDKLPYEIQYTIGSPEVLRSWAVQESDSLSVLQSNFQRAYRARAQYVREVKALPADARQMMGQLTAGKFDLNAYLLQEATNAKETTQD